MSVITHVKKSGNSFALHLPKTFVDAHHLNDDRRFKMDFEGGKIVAEPLSAVSDEEAEHDRLFAMLSAGMTPDNVHRELLKSAPVGSELL